MCLDIRIKHTTKNSNNFFWTDLKRLFAFIINIYYKKYVSSSVTKQPSQDPFNYPNDWHNELFDCCDDKKICVPAFICFPL